MQTRFSTHGMAVSTCIEQWCVPAGKDIEKQCSGIYPLQSVYVRKVKILRAPRFDVTKLMEVHGDYSEEVCKHPSAVFFVNMVHGYLLTESLHVAEHFAVSCMPGHKGLQCDIAVTWL